MGWDVKGGWGVGIGLMDILPPFQNKSYV
jgi:hypothetical protein